MMDSRDCDTVELLTAYRTMRKYQNRYFAGDKSALKMAKYWENQMDNLAAKHALDYHLVLTPEPKGGPANTSQGSLL